jgi:hypothetical protein
MWSSQKSKPPLKKKRKKIRVDILEISSSSQPLGFRIIRQIVILPLPGTTPQYMRIDFWNGLRIG